MDGSNVNRNGEENENIEAVINMYKSPVSHQIFFIPLVHNGPMYFQFLFYWTLVHRVYLRYSTLFFSTAPSFFLPKSVCSSFR